MGAALPREAEPPDNPMDPPPHKRFRGNPLRAAVALGILLSLPRAPVTMAVSCGAGTSYVPATASCCTFSACSANDSATSHVYLGGVFDVSSAVGYAGYTKHHFTLAVDLINNHTDGIWDDVLTDAQIKISMADVVVSAKRTDIGSCGWLQLEDAQEGSYLFGDCPSWDLDVVMRNLSDVPNGSLFQSSVLP